MADRIAVPTEVAGLHLLARVDYEDAFATETHADRPPEQWVRQAFDRAPPGLATFARSAQRVLGLHLDAVDAAHPLGWTILRSDDEMFVLGAQGSSAQGRIVATTTPGWFVLTTQLFLADRRARYLWTAIAPAHRTVASFLIERTVNRRRASARLNG